jgi:cysteine desulfurase/selenocysteine lyase
MLRDEKGCQIRVIPCNDAGELQLDEYERLFSDRTKLVAVTHVSNALGTVNPVKQMIQTAHRHGVPVLSMARRRCRI